MSETNAGTEGRKRAAAANFLPIVRGRLPLLFVHAIRFDETLKDMSVKDVATKFATSVGKVFDIRKNRNFAYIGADYKPTAEDVATARGWIGAVGAENAKGKTAQGDTALMSRVVSEYEARGLGTADDAAKVSEARAANRQPAERKPKASAGEGATAGASTGADLLA